jgi:outer membrane receptor for ferrienterochelin and colicins
LSNQNRVYHDTKTMLATELVLLAALQLPQPACAVSGQVSDASGAPLPGVTVVAPSMPAPVMTDAEGRYCIRSLAPGRHELTIVLAGFSPERVVVDLATPGGIVRDVSLAQRFSETVVVTGTRTTKLLDSVPVRTEIISSRAIAASGARSLADAMEFTTGVRVENNCQNCNFSQIRLLGLEGPYTQILVDGQPMMSSLAQVYGIEQIPARLIERIEVVKGGGSSLYGAGAVGGVVNIISRQPAQTSGVFELRAENGGSANGAFDFVSDDLMTTVSVFGQHDRIDARDVDNDGFSDVSQRRLTASGLRGTRFVMAGRGKVVVDVSDIREARRGGDALDRPPHEALVAESIDSARQSYSVGWTHSPGGGVDYRLTGAVARTDRDSYYGTGRDPNAYGETSSLLTLFDGQVNHYSTRHIVSWGGQVSRDRTIDRQPAYSRRIDESYTSRGLFVQDDWSIGRGWQVLSGVRLDWHSTLTSPVVSPRMAVMFSPTTALDIRVSAARGFRAPQVFDEDLHLSSVGGEVRIITLDPDLGEERSTGFMAGVEWKPVAGPGQALVEANVFHTKLNDLFHAIEHDDPSTPRLELLKTNLGSAAVYGLEVNLGWGMGDDLVLQGGFVVQRAEFDRPEPDFGSRQFFRTPRHYGNLTARWASHGGWELFGGLRMTGSMQAPHYAGFIAEDRLETTAAFATVDTSIGRRLTVGGRTLVVSVIAKNLTDAYQPDLDRGPLRDASYVYGPRFPRSIGLNMRVEF